MVSAVIPTAVNSGLGILKKLGSCAYSQLNFMLPMLQLNFQGPMGNSHRIRCEGGIDKDPLEYASDREVLHLDSFFQ